MSQMTEQQISEAREVFDLMDKNSDGKICFEEYTTAAQAMGLQPTKAELKESFDQADISAFCPHLSLSLD